MNIASADDTTTRLRSLFEAARLAFPPVPPHLAGGLRERRDEVFSTRELAQSPYALAPYVAEAAERAGMEDYAVVAFDGHGVNSRAVHYYLVCGPLALFIQLPWGGAYIDVDEARAEVGRMFAWAAKVQDKVDTARRLGRIAPGRRLMIVASRFYDAGWRWVDAGAPADVSGWNSPGGMMISIEEMLDGLAAGR